MKFISDAYAKVTEVKNNPKQAVKDAASATYSATQQYHDQIKDGFLCLFMANMATQQASDCSCDNSISLLGTATVLCGMAAAVGQRHVSKAINYCMGDASQKTTPLKTDDVDSEEVSDLDAPKSPAI